MKTHTITILSVIGVLGTATATMAINADALSSASQRPIDRASEVLVPGQSSTPSPFPTPFLTPFPTPSSTDDPATHDVNDDNGVDNPATHDLNDDNSVDNPATHDVNDDNGGVVDDKSGSGSDSSGSGHGEDD